MLETGSDKTDSTQWTSPEKGKFIAQRQHNVTIDEYNERDYVAVPCWGTLYKTTFADGKGPAGQHIIRPGILLPD